MCPYLCHLLSCCLLIQSVIFSVSCFLFPVFLTESEPPLLSSWTVLPFFLFFFIHLSVCPFLTYFLSCLPLLPPTCPPVPPSLLPSLFLTVRHLFLLSFQSFLSYCFLFPVSVPPSLHLHPFHILSLLCLFLNPICSFLLSSLLISSFPSFCPCLLPSFLPSVLSLSHFSSHPSSSLVSSDSKSRPGSDSSPL